MNKRADDKEVGIEEVKQMVAKAEGKPIELKPEKTPEKASEKTSEELPRRKKVCIVGFAPSSFPLAPYSDQDMEIWGLNI